LNHQANLPSVSRFERSPSAVHLRPDGCCRTDRSNPAAIEKPDKIACLLGPGAWVVVQGKLTADGHNNKDRLKTTCPVPECGKEFSYMSNIGLNRVHHLVDSTRKD
jgi:hypothetical protein